MSAQKNSLLFSVYKWAERQPSWVLFPFCIATLILTNLAFLLDPHFDINSDAAGGALVAWKSVSTQGFQLFENGKMLSILDLLLRMSIGAFGPTTASFELPHQLLSLGAALFLFSYLRSTEGLLIAFAGFLAFVFPGSFQSLYLDAWPTSDCLFWGGLAFWLYGNRNLSVRNRGFAIACVGAYCALFVYKPVLSFFLAIATQLRFSRVYRPTASRRDSFLLLSRFIYSISFLCGWIWVLFFVGLLAPFEFIRIQMSVNLFTKFCYLGALFSSLTWVAGESKGVRTLLNRWAYWIFVGLLMGIGIVVWKLSRGGSQALEGAFQFQQATFVNLPSNLEVFHQVVSKYIGVSDSQNPFHYLSFVFIGLFYAFNLVQITLMVAHSEFRRDAKASLVFHLYCWSVLMFLLQGNLVSEVEVRYLPALQWAYFVLLAKQLQFFWRGSIFPKTVRTVLSYAIGILLGVTAGSYGTQQSLPHKKGQQIQDILQHLEANQVTQGYGDYWYGYNLTFLTQKRMVIRPLHSQFLEDYRGPFPNHGRTAFILKQDIPSNLISAYKTDFRILSRKKFGEAYVFITDVQEEQKPEPIKQPPKRIKKPSTPRSAQ